MSSLSTSGPPGLLLSPPPGGLPQQSRKTISSVKSRSSYFPTNSSRSASPPGSPPPEEGLPPSQILVGPASSSYASDSGSEYISLSSESAYLTPPQSRGDNDKPPYKARNLSSASLNMTSNHTTPKDHSKRVKKKYLKHRRKPRSENDNDHEWNAQEGGFHTQDVLPRYERNGTRNKVADKSYERVGTVANSIRGWKKTWKDTQVTLTAATNVTTRRWSSVGIGADRYSGIECADTTTLDTAPMGSNHKRSNNRMHIHENLEIMKLVRARLTSHEVNADYQPTPATITLRRATEVPTDPSLTSLTSVEGKLDVSVLSLPEERGQTRLPTLTYLITTDDIHFITNLIQSGFDVRRMKINLTDHDGLSPRKPSITSRGLLVESSNPADLATTVTDVHQVPRLPRILYEDLNLTITKPMRGVTRNVSPVLSLQNIPEIIWEDTRSTERRCRSSKASSSSEAQKDCVNETRATWAYGQSLSTNQEARSPPAESPKESQHIRHDEDHSPTSRVFQWVFKEPAEGLKNEPGPSTTHDETTKHPDSHAEFVKRKSLPSISSVIPDVFSFPALPTRKFTSDWISPLPDLSAPPSDHRKSLDESRIDAQVVDDSEHFSALSSHAEKQNSQLGGTRQQRQHSSSAESDCQMRRKSAILLHQQVSPRLGDSFKVGNALGCSSGARRKSSTPSIHLKVMSTVPDHTLSKDHTSCIQPRRFSEWLIPRSPPTDSSVCKESCTVDLSSQNPSTDWNG